LSVRASETAQTPIKNVAAPDKGFTAKDGEAIQLRIKRILDLIDDIEAETRAFKEEVKVDAAKPR
jgi:ClpP class serine protease